MNARGLPVTRVEGSQPSRRSQVTPKTPHGKMLKYSLSYAERKAFRRLERYVQEASEAPPEPEDFDGGPVEDLEAGEEPDEEGEEEDERDEL